LKYDSQVWGQYFLNVRLNEKWSGNFDGGYRRTDEFVNKPLQWLGRIGGTYHLNNDVSLTLGYAFFSLFTETTKSSFYRSEHRPWMRLTIIQKYNKLQIQHRYRFENRNIQKNDLDGLLTDFNSFYRIGYQLNLQYVLKGNKVVKGTPFLVAFNELFVNFGSSIVNNYDQNRSFIGFGYGLNNSLSTTFGYQYIYSQVGTNTFAHLNTLRINIIQNIDLRIPKSETNENKEINR